MSDLSTIEAKLDELLLRVPEVSETQQALQDVLEILATMDQVREALEANRDRLETMTREFVTARTKADAERFDIHQTLVQIRQLMRKHVQGLVDLTNAVTEVIDPPQERQNDT